MMFFDGFVIYDHNAMWRCGEIWWALGHLAKVPNFWQLDQKISMSRTSIDRISTLRWSYIENVDIFQRRFSSAFICSQPECSSTPNKKDMTKVLTFQRKFVFQCRVLWMPSRVRIPGVMKKLIRNRDFQNWSCGSGSGGKVIFDKCFKIGHRDSSMNIDISSINMIKMIRMKSKLQWLNQNTQSWIWVSSVI